MYLNDDDPYALHWPMKGGNLNLHSDVGGSLTSVCADLEAIWAHGIENYLNIPKASLQVTWFISGCGFHYELDTFYQF